MADTYSWRVDIKKCMATEGGAIIKLTHCCRKADLENGEVRADSTHLECTLFLKVAIIKFFNLYFCRIIQNPDTDLNCFVSQKGQKKQNKKTHQLIINQKPTTM